MPWTSTPLLVAVAAPAVIAVLRDGTCAFLAGSLGNLLRQRPRHGRGQRDVSGTIDVALGAVAAPTGHRRP